MITLDYGPDIIAPLANNYTKYKKEVHEELKSLIEKKIEIQPVGIIYNLSSRMNIAMATTHTNDWFLADVIQQTSFNLCFSNTYHNPIVKTGTRVYCTKCDILPHDMRPATGDYSKGEPLYFCLFKRPKGYWVGKYFTEKSGSGVLKTNRNASTNKAFIVKGNVLLDELNIVYDKITRVKPAANKSIFLFNDF